MNELSVARSDFDKEIEPFVQDLFSPEANDWNEMATKYIESYYEINCIPTVGELIEGMLEENINAIHSITRAAMNHKFGSVNCNSREYGGCDNCHQFDDCYESVFDDCMDSEFYDETSPLKLAWGLYEILYQGQICILMENEDLMCYGDLLRYYDYDNEDLLWDYFKGFDSGKEPKIIINHAQQTMFDELYIEGIGNCFNYGRQFILLHDSFDTKYSQDYYLEGGK